MVNHERHNGSIKPEIVRELLLSAFPQADIRISTYDQRHYAIEITDEIFRDQSLVTQHRLVKNVLADALKTGLHAVSIKTLIPNQ